MSAKTVDTGTPPESVVRRQKIKELLLSGDDLQDSEVVPENEVAAQPVVQDEPKRQVTNKRVTLHHELYSLTLPALDVSIAEHQVAVRLPDNSFKFEPRALNSEFIISYLGKDYRVAYLGGIFDFPGDDSWVIAFIRDKRNSDGEERKD